MKEHVVKEHVVKQHLVRAMQYQVYTHISISVQGAGVDCGRASSVQGTDAV